MRILVLVALLVEGLFGAAQRYKVDREIYSLLDNKWRRGTSPFKNH